MPGLSKVAEHYSEKYPHMPEYNKCQSNAFMTGLLATASSAAAAFVLQDMFKSRLPYYSPKSFILMPVFVGTIFGFSVSLYKTRNCQQMWRALEDKDTAINPMSEKEVLK